MDTQNFLLPNPPAAAHTAVLLAAFGTSHAPARAAYAALEEAVRAAFPAYALAWAYTSPTVRKKLLAEGEEAHAVPTALSRLAAAGKTRVAVLSVHVTPGEEFYKLCAACQNGGAAGAPWPARIEVGEPLLAADADLAALAAGLIAEEGGALKSDEGLLFIGHGARNGAGSLVYPALQYFLTRGHPLAWVTPLEGEPQLERVLDEARARGLARLRLAPLMAVAGEHIMHDVLGGHRDSIRGRAESAGFICVASPLGLAQRPCAQNIWLNHLGAALARLNQGDA